MIDGTVLTARDDIKTDPYVFAFEKHMGQSYGDKPYITHVETVFAITYQALARFLEYDPYEDTGRSHVLLTAALLHDVVEDCFDDREVGMVEVRTLFGDRVGDLVEYLTDPDGDSRTVRKAKFLAKMGGIMSEDDPRFDALVVKYGDRIANFGKSIDDRDERRIKMYLREMPDFFYLARAVKHHPLLKSLYDHLADLREDAYDIVGREV